VGPDTDFTAGFAADRDRRIAERLPAAAVAFAGALGIAWVFEHRSFPERDFLYAVLYGLELLILAVAVWLVRTRRLQRCARPISVVAVVALIACITAYHVIVGSTGDVLVLALLYVLVGSMVAIPWGWQGQIFVSSAAVSSFAVALATGAQPVVPPGMHFLGLTTMAVLTVLGAAFLEAQRLSLFEQAAQLRRSNQALEEANRALRQANATKNEFLASVSHELRTPLNIITGYVDLLLEGAFGNLSPEATEALDRVARTSRTLVFLISDLLDLSRVEAGRLTVETTRVELDPIFEDMRAYIEPRISGKPIEFKILSSGLAVRADRHRLEQILLNLLSNAAKFTERGEICLTARNEANGHVEILVRDTGVGISPEEMPYLFEPFRQGAAGQRAGGVGIGLALSARLAAAMGGEITVSSDLGRGSTFVVRLPAANQPPHGS
jgi:signal transduction histidine kinase